MPILPIDYLMFSPKNLFHNNQGKLYGSNKDWVSNSFRNEASARSELLFQEFLRFLIDDQATISVLAKKRAEGLFFVLKEKCVSKINSPRAVEEAFVRAMFKILFFSSSNLKTVTLSAISVSVLSAYYRTISNHPEMKERLMIIVLRMMLLSSASFLSLFVNSCIENKKQEATLTLLVNFQQLVINYFMNQPYFKRFLSSEIAQQESVRFLEDIKRFQPHGDYSFMEDDYPEVMQAIYTRQWMKIQSTLHEGHSHTLDAGYQEELFDDDSLGFFETIEPISQTPRLREASNTPHGQIATSPLSVANNSPTTAETNTRRFTPLTLCAFFSNPLSFMATARGISMGIIPIASDEMDRPAVEFTSVP